MGNIILFRVSKYTIWDIRNLSKVLFSFKNPYTIRLKGGRSRAVLCMLCTILRRLSTKLGIELVKLELNLEKLASILKIG